MDRGAWQATAHGVSELDTTERLTLSFPHLLRAARDLNLLLISSLSSGERISSIKPPQMHCPKYVTGFPR